MTKDPETATVAAKTGYNGEAHLALKGIAYKLQRLRDDGRLTAGEAEKSLKEAWQWLWRDTNGHTARVFTRIAAFLHDVQPGVRSALVERLVRRQQP